MQKIITALFLVTVYLAPAVSRAESPDGGKPPESGARLYVDLYFAPVLKVLDILSQRAVQEELHPSKEQLKSIKNVEMNGAPDESSTDANPASKQKIAGKSDDEADFQRHFQSALNAIYKLLTPGQSTRLQEILWQVDGLKSLRTDPKLQTALGLSPEQNKRVSSVFGLYDPKLNSLYHLLDAQTITSLSPDQTIEQATKRANSLAESITAIEKQRDGDLYGVLTTAQRQKWTEMSGKPIEIQWDEHFHNPSDQ